MTRFRHNRGASLLELTCALFVVTLGAFGALHMYMLGMDKTKNVHEYDIAMQALNNEVETLRAVAFDELTVGKELPFVSETPAAERLINVERRAAIVDKTGDTRGLKQVRVHIRWTGEHGRTIEKHLTTLIAKKGVL